MDCLNPMRQSRNRDADAEPFKATNLSTVGAHRDAGGD